MKVRNMQILACVILLDDSNLAYQKSWLLTHGRGSPQIILAKLVN